MFTITVRVLSTSNYLHIMMLVNHQGFDATETTSSSGFFGRMVGRITGKPVPEAVIQFHHKTFRELSSKAWHVQRLQVEKFDNSEFAMFIRIQRDLHLNRGKHKSIKHAVELLEVSLAVKDSFLLIEQTEMRFRSSMQQKFYGFINQLLTKNYTPQKSLELVGKAFKKIYKHIKTQQGRAVMKDYVGAIKIIFRHRFGIELLTLFKKSKLKYYTMLFNISRLVKTMRKKDVRDLRKLAVIVHEHRADFEQLGKILEIPQELNSPNTYARMVQYITLKHRHQTSAAQFQKLMQRLVDWEDSFYVLMEIRREYTTQKYQPINEFFSSVPAWDIYRKYKRHIDSYRDEVMERADCWT